MQGVRVQEVSHLALAVLAIADDVSYAAEPCDQRIRHPDFQRFIPRLSRHRLKRQHGETRHGHDTMVGGAVDRRSDKSHRIILQNDTVRQLLLQPESPW